MDKIPALKMMHKLYKLPILQIEKIGPKLWRLTEDFTYINILDRISFRIPKGFITDLSSVPKAFQWFMTPGSGPQAEAGVVHDYFYSKDCNFTFERKFCDDLWRYVAILYGMSPIKAKAIYFALRLGGASSYKKKYSSEKIINAYGDN